MEPVDPNYLEAILSVLTGHGATFFECAQFKVGFVLPEDDDEEEGAAVTAIGFDASPNDDDDEYDPEESLRRQHSRAFGAPMPLLNPPAPPGKKE